MPLYPVRALERAMKISEVITRAISGRINWIQAAEILGMSPYSTEQARGLKYSKDTNRPS